MIPALSRFVLFLWLGLAVIGPVRAAEVQTLTPTSFAAIRERFSGRAFLVAFWSVNCEPCKAEITLIAGLHRSYPDVPVVLIAADQPSLRPAVVRFLGRQELGRIETWQFGDAAEERLRYTVDPTWHGELPRAVFFDAKHAPTAHSGVPDAAWTKAWFAAARNGK
ncbi:MAG: TlpA family protein disulfide reductase [Verrucomicrobiota bacterium]|jgi:thiol-disulfide isomerase/thioredoxin